VLSCDAWYQADVLGRPSVPRRRGSSSPIGKQKLIRESYIVSNGWSLRIESAVMPVAEKESQCEQHVSRPKDRFLTSSRRDLAFELPVPDRWLDDLKDRIIVNYTGPVTLQDHHHAHSKPVITYLSRQTAAHRRLKEETHDALVAALMELDDEGVADVYVEEFTDADPKDEQVAKLSRTTVRRPAVRAPTSISSFMSDRFSLACTETA
jgi:hypothetical protein